MYEYRDMKIKTVEYNICIFPCCWNDKISMWRESIILSRQEDMASFVDGIKAILRTTQDNQLYNGRFKFIHGFLKITEIWVAKYYPHLSLPISSSVNYEYAWFEFFSLRKISAIEAQACFPKSSDWPPHGFYRSVWWYIPRRAGTCSKYNYYG